VLTTLSLGCQHWNRRVTRMQLAKRGWQLTGEFVDIGVSGSKDPRLQLDAMMRLAKARKLDVIAVWKLDPFDRSLRHLVDALAELKAVGCAFVSLRDNLDLTTPAGRMMFHALARWLSLSVN
jgi:DNA invertase Pin-like site-specific DNA recombinase